MPGAFIFGAVRVINTRKAVRMLLELAIGDAYGAAFEYADTEYIRRYNDATRYVSHPRREIERGHYTDDTQMSIAIAEAIAAGDEWTPLALANRFVEVFHRDPRAGYAGGFYFFLYKTETGGAFLRQIRPDSDKSGAAMRAAPIGVFPTIAEVIEKSTIQAKLTHNTPNGIAAAVAASLMTHYFLYRHGPKAGLGEFLEEYVPGHPWAQPFRHKVGSAGWMSVRAAVTAVVDHHCLTDILRAAVANTGDVDTVATIALAAASCSTEVEQNLPVSLVEGLENGTYGRDYLRSLDQQLLARIQFNPEGGR
ncbi:MAG: hypothetical protein OHK0029_04490 [Armatimonadaceae bacterium]